MPATTKMSTDEYRGQHLLEISHLVEVKIGHELNLINHRISWLATSQSFLFVAVATLLTSDYASAHLAARVFLFSIPVVGLCLCFVVLGAVNAALRVLSRDLLPERAALVVEINRISGLTLAPLGPDRLTEFFGALPARWIPIIFGGSWFIVIGLLVWRAASR